MNKDPKLATLMDRLDDLDAKLITVQSLARFIAEVTGDVSEGCVQVQLPAIFGAMSYFADEIDASRKALRPVRDALPRLPGIA